MGNKILSENTKLKFLETVDVNGVKLNKQLITVETNGKKFNFTIVSENNFIDDEVLDNETLENYLLNCAIENQDKSEIYVGKIIDNDGNPSVEYNKDILDKYGMKINESNVKDNSSNEESNKNNAIDTSKKNNSFEHTNNSTNLDNNNENIVIDGKIDENPDEMSAFSTSIANFNTFFGKDGFESMLKNLSSTSSSRGNFPNTNNILGEVFNAVSSWQKSDFSQSFNNLNKYHKTLTSNSLSYLDTSLISDIDGFIDNFRSTYEGGNLSDDELIKNINDKHEFLKNKENLTIDDINSSIREIMIKDMIVNEDNFDDYTRYLTSTNYLSNNSNEIEKLVSNSSDNTLDSLLEELKKNPDNVGLKTAIISNLSETESGRNILIDARYEYYATEAGQEEFRNQFYYDETGEKIFYDDKLVNTMYVRSCISLGHTDWIVDELKDTVSALKFIWNDSQSVVMNKDGLPIDEKGNVINLLDNDAINRIQYTKFGQKGLEYMDLELHDDDKWDTAFSNNVSSLALYNNARLEYIDTHDAVNGISPEEQWTVLEQAESKKIEGNELTDKENEIIDLLHSKGIYGFSEQLNLSTAVNEFASLNGISLTKIDKENKEVEKTFDEIKSELINKFNLTEDELKDTASLEQAFKDRKNIIGNEKLTKAIKGLCLLSGVEESVVLASKVGEGFYQCLEQIVDAGIIMYGSDFNYMQSHLLNPVFYIKDGFLDFDDVCEIYGLKDEYKEEYKKAFDDYKLEMESQKDEWLNSKEGKNAIKMAKETYGHSQLSNSISGLEDYAWSDYLQRSFKYNGITFSDTSSSSLYYSAYIDGIRGNTTNYNKLMQNETFMDMVSNQFDAMDLSQIDVVSNIYEKFYNSRLYSTIENLSVIKNDSLAAEIAQQVGQMAPSVLMNFVPGVGQVLSTVTLGLSSFGSGSVEALKSGAGYNQAIAYGTVSAAIEMITEKMFSGVAGYGEGWFDNLASSGIDKFLSKINNGKLLDNPFAQTCKAFVLKGLGEGVEEVSGDLMNPYAQYLCYLGDQTNMTLEEYALSQYSLKDLAHTFIVSALTSFVFGGSEITGNIKNYNSSVNFLQNIANNHPYLQQQLDKGLAHLVGSGDVNLDSFNSMHTLNKIMHELETDLANSTDPKVRSELESLKNELVFMNDKLNQEVEVSDGKTTIKIKQKDLIETTSLFSTGDALNHNLFSKFLVQNEDGTFNITDSNIAGQYINQVKQYGQSILYNGLGLSSSIENYMNENKDNVYEVEQAKVDLEIIKKALDASKQIITEDNYSSLGDIINLDLEYLNKKYTPNKKNKHRKNTISNVENKDTKTVTDQIDSTRDVVVQKEDVVNQGNEQVQEPVVTQSESPVVIQSEESVITQYEEPVLTNSYEVLDSNSTSVSETTDVSTSTVVGAAIATGTAVSSIAGDSSVTSNSTVVENVDTNDSTIYDSVTEPSNSNETITEEVTKEDISSEDEIVTKQDDNVVKKSSTVSAVAESIVHNIKNIKQNISKSVNNKLKLNKSKKMSEIIVKNKKNQSSLSVDEAIEYLNNCIDENGHLTEDGVKYIFENIKDTDINKVIGELYKINKDIFGKDSQKIKKIFDLTSNSDYSFSKNIYECLDENGEFNIQGLKFLFTQELSIEKLNVDFFDNSTLNVKDIYKLLTEYDSNIFGKYSSLVQFFVNNNISSPSVLFTNINKYVDEFGFLNEDGIELLIKKYDILKLDPELLKNITIEKLDTLKFFHDITDIGNIVKYIDNDGCISSEGLEFLYKNEYVKNIPSNFVNNDILQRNLSPRLKTYYSLYFDYDIFIDTIDGITHDYIDLNRLVDESGFITLEGLSYFTTGFSKQKIINIKDIILLNDHRINTIYDLFVNYDFRFSSSYEYLYKFIDDNGFLTLDGFSHLYNMLHNIRSRNEIMNIIDNFIDKKLLEDKRINTLYNIFTHHINLRFSFDSSNISEFIDENGYLTLDGLFSLFKTNKKYGSYDVLREFINPNLLNKPNINTLYNLALYGIDVSIIDSHNIETHIDENGNLTDYCIEHFEFDSITLKKLINDKYITEDKLNNRSKLIIEITLGNYMPSCFKGNLTQCINENGEITTYGIEQLVFDTHALQNLIDNKYIIVEKLNNRNRLIIEMALKNIMPSCFEGKLDQCINEDGEITNTGLEQIFKGLQSKQIIESLISNNILHLENIDQVLYKYVQLHILDFKDLTFNEFINSHGKLFQFIKQLYLGNNNLFHTLNFDMINLKIIDCLDYIVYEKITRYGYLQQNLINMINNYQNATILEGKNQILNIFREFCNLSINKKSSLYLSDFIPYFIENFNSNSKLSVLYDISLKHELSSQQIKKLIYFVSMYKNDASMPEIKTYEDFLYYCDDNNIRKYYDNLIEKCNDINILRNIILSRNVGLSLDKAHQMLLMYGGGVSYFKNFSKYEMETKYLEHLDLILRENDIRKLKDIYLDYSSKSFGDRQLFIELSLKEMYGDNFASSIYKIPNEHSNIKDIISLNPDASISHDSILSEYDGDIYYLPSGRKFHMLVHSLNSINSIGSIFKINDNYRDTWLYNGKSDFHNLCCCAISDKKIAIVPVKDVLLGFDFSKESFYYLGPSDLGSHSLGYNLDDSAGQSRFNIIDNIIEETDLHNEIVLERHEFREERVKEIGSTFIYPRYVVVFSDFSDKLKENAIKCAKDMNIPIVYIDR